MLQSHLFEAMLRVLAANPEVATLPTTKEEQAKPEEQVIEELSTKEEQVEDVLRAIYGCLMDLQRIEDVDADEDDELAERSDTETSSIDDGCLVESGLCKEKPSNKRKRGSERIAEQLNECGVRMANTTDEVELKWICGKINTLCWLLVGREKKGRTKRSSE